MIMKRSVIVGLAVIVALPVCVSARQASGTADPRLSDPAFIKARDEALAAAKCPDRTEPVAITTPKAQYPAVLRGSGVSGTALTESIILPDGHLAFSRVMSTTSPEFGQAALEVLKRYRYKPGTCGGRPVPRFVTVTITFAAH